jgi:hypothetical protein
MRIKKGDPPCETLHFPDMISDLLWGMRGLAIIIVAVVAPSAMASASLRATTHWTNASRKRTLTDVGRRARRRAFPSYQKKPGLRSKP